MKIIHTADWHIGNTFYGYGRLEEHRDFLDFLLGTIEAADADALIAAGDVFDNPNPSADAQRLYYDFLHEAVKRNPGLQIVVIAGNHDSAARLEAPSALLADDNITVRGSLHRDDEGNVALDDVIVPLHAKNSADDEVICLAVPFVRASELPQEDTFSRSMGKLFNALIKETRHRYGKDKRLVLAAHFYATGSEISAEDHSERIIIGGEENVDASKFCQDLSYVALGHIHKAQHVGGMENVRYSGSALPMSFTERNYRHGVNLVEISEEGKVSLTTYEYDVPRKLERIAVSGETSAEEFGKEIKKRYPQAKSGEAQTHWPYVEIELSGSSDNITLNSFKEAFDGRAALLCDIRNKNDVAADYEKMEARTTEQLRKLNPLTIVESLYKGGNDGKEMPQELTDKFNAALKIAQEREEQQ